MSSTLRLIKPLPDTQGRLVPGGQIEPRPTFQSVKPTSLWVDESYQRNISHRGERLIRDIVRDWSWGNFKAPICVETANGLVVIDGQHTAIAAATRGISFIPVLVVDAANVADQAKAFLGQNTKRLNVTKTQIFHAAVAAGDEDALTAKQVCERARVNILLSPPGREFEERETMAVSAVVSLAQKHGAMVARKILEALADGGLAPIKAMHIRAAEGLMRDKGWASSRMSYTDLSIVANRTGDICDDQAKLLGTSMKIQQFKALEIFWSRQRPVGAQKKLDAGVTA